MKRAGRRIMIAPQRDADGQDSINQGVYAASVGFIGVANRSIALCGSCVTLPGRPQPAAATPTAENIITKEYDVGWVQSEKEGPLIDRLLAHAVAATTAAEVSDQTSEL